LLAKFLVFAIVALSVDLLWGYAGVLSLGHGVFFGLGAYAMAMYLKLEGAAGDLPDFMAWSGLKEMPWFWLPFQHAWIVLLAALLVPMLVAVVLGYFAFRSRVRDVYFSLVTQALALIVTILLVGQQPYTGGTNGMTNFQTILGQSLADRTTQIALYGVTVGVLIGCFALCLAITRSRFGRLLHALRDDENRLRFYGYEPVWIKLIVFAVSAGMAGLAGALFVPQVGIISPALIGIVPSIEMVIWVAVGGRGTLAGAVVGALVVNAAKSTLSESFPDVWQYFLGGLFIGVVLLFPDGLVGFARRGASWLGRRMTGAVVAEQLPARASFAPATVVERLAARNREV